MDGFVHKPQWVVGQPRNSGWGQCGGLRGGTGSPAALDGDKGAHAHECTQHTCTHAAHTAHACTWPHARAHAKTNTHVLRLRWASFGGVLAELLQRAAPNPALLCWAHSTATVVQDSSSLCTYCTLCSLLPCVEVYVLFGTCSPHSLSPHCRACAALETRQAAGLQGQAGQPSCSIQHQCTLDRGQQNAAVGEGQPSATARQQAIRGPSWQGHQQQLGCEQ